jgi:hypothetical protein
MVSQPLSLPKSPFSTQDIALLISSLTFEINSANLDCLRVFRKVGVDNFQFLADNCHIPISQILRFLYNLKLQASKPLNLKTLNLNLQHFNLQHFSSESLNLQHYKTEYLNPKSINHKSLNLKSRHHINYQELGENLSIYSINYQELGENLNSISNSHLTIFPF